MAGALKESRQNVSERPTPSYQDLLDMEERPVPETLRENYNECGRLNSEDITVDRYLSPEYYRLEVDQMWSHVWQMACRVEQLPNVGDYIVYNVADYSLIIVRSAPDEIKAYYNSCLHRGRMLCESDGHVRMFRCKFHGFTWEIDGRLRFVPGRWDFAHIKDEDFRLPEAKAGTWGGFVFINMDPNARPLEEYLSILPRHFERWNFEDRFLAVHVGVIIPANWKVATEAFLETWHVMMTHPQVMPFTGEFNSQYDVRTDLPHYSRLSIPMGIPSPVVKDQVSEKDIVEVMKWMLGRTGEDLAVPPGMTIRQYAAQLSRERATQTTNGRDFSKVTDSEMIDAIVYFTFPNLILWGGYSNLVYRYRPWRDHEHALMELMLLPLRPIDAPTPPPAPFHLLPEGQTFSDATELGGFGPFFDQDLGNMEWVQKGMKASHKRSLTLADYQESQIRHFNRTLDGYISGKPPATR